MLKIRISPGYGFWLNQIIVENDLTVRSMMTKLYQTTSVFMRQIETSISRTLEVHFWYPWPWKIVFHRMPRSKMMKRVV